MTVHTQPKILIEPAGNDSGPIEAILVNSGEIRLRTGADVTHLHTTWLTPAEIRELATELLGLADASEAIYG